MESQSTQTHKNCLLITQEIKLFVGLWFVALKSSAIHFFIFENLVDRVLCLGLPVNSNDRH
jgi:hypothetical protein